MLFDLGSRVLSPTRFLPWSGSLQSPPNTYRVLDSSIVPRSVQTLRLADFMTKKTMGFEDTGASDATGTGWTPTPVTPPRPLDLALSPASLRSISSAEAAFDQLINDHEVRDKQIGLPISMG